MKRVLLIICVYWTSVHSVILAGKPFGLCIACLLCLILTQKESCFKENQNEQDFCHGSNKLWEIFSKEFVVGLAKAAVSLLTALLGILLLGKTCGTSTLTAIRVSLGAIILSQITGSSKQYKSKNLLFISEDAEKMRDYVRPIMQKIVRILDGLLLGKKI